MIDPKKFELLSSYLDGEVTASEKAQVEAWLNTDRDFAQCYQQQLKLQQIWKATVSHSPMELSFEDTWQHIQTRQKERWLVRGIAFLTLGLVSLGGLFVSQRYSWQQAQEEPLILALEQPLLPMPKDLLQD